MSPSCGAARYMNFFLNGTNGAPLVAAPHILGTSIWTLASGASKVVSQRFGMQQTTSCGELDFNSQYSGASNVKVSRLSDGIDAAGAVVRRWRIESQGNHVAACVKMQSNGKFVDSGLRFYLPFGVTVTQVRYPYPKFP